MEIIIILLIIALLSTTLVLFNNSKKGLVNDKHTMTTKQMTYIVIFATLSIILGFIEIPLGIVGGKLDFSDVIILIAFYVLGFKNVSFVIFLRSLVRVFLPAKTPMEAEILWKIFGEVIAICASYLIIFGTIITNKVLGKKDKPLIYAVPAEEIKVSLKEYILNSLITTIILTATLTVFHIFITVPAWNKIFLDDPMFLGKNFKELLIMIISMFGLLNLVKGIVLPIIFLFIKPQTEKIFK